MCLHPVRENKQLYRSHRPQFLLISVMSSQMDDNFVLLGGGPAGDGGGVPSDESTTAGKNNHCMSAEVSSPSPVVADDQNLELGLGLSIGGGCCGGDGGGQRARMLTANSSVYPSGVVGWPPLRRAHRLAFHTKSPQEQLSSTPKPNRDLKDAVKEVVFENGYKPVKVIMDGFFYRRKVDLNAHDSYKTLAQTLEDMFFEKGSSTKAAGPSILLNATSEFVLTYEDKDGNWMLVGDVSWQMFLRSVKRLRIKRNAESVGLSGCKRSIASPTCEEKSITSPTCEVKKPKTGI